MTSPERQIQDRFYFILSLLCVATTLSLSILTDINRAGNQIINTIDLCLNYYYLRQPAGSSF